MERRRRFFTLEEAVAAIQEEDYEDADLIVLPPENSGDSDVDEGDDTELGGDVIVTDVPGEVEVHMRNEGSQSDLEDEVEEEEGAHGCPWSNKYKEAKDPKWQSFEGRLTHQPAEGDSHVQRFRELVDRLDGLTPVQCFELVFSGCIDILVEETNRYAHEMKNDPTFCVTKDEMKAFLGILIFTGYHRLPSQEHYWNRDEDLGVQCVKDTMPSKAFLKIKQYLHCANNNELNTDDRSFKVKKLFDKLNDDFLKFGVFHNTLCIDEMIVKYYGHHGLKQFIRGKPIRFGFKLWALCSSDGYVYSFYLYQGKERNIPNKIPMGFRVVMELMDKIDDPRGKELYFDNLFTSLSLLVSLRDMGVKASGTIRANRTKGAPFESDKALKKERGLHSTQFDSVNQLMMVKWNDNSMVHIATNFSSVQPFVDVNRYCSKSKQRVKIKQPQMISEYNKYMGGVDHMDWLASHYAIAIRGKKWYFPLITRAIQMALVNSWKMFKLANADNQISLLNFTREVAVTFMKKTHGNPSILSRQRAHADRFAAQPGPGDGRYDNRGHFMQTRDKQRRCQGVGCTKKPLSFCVKCNVTLCKSCFEGYHRQ